MATEAVYMGWYDPSKIPADRKITIAMERYEEKFGVPPDVVLVNVELADMVVPGMRVEASSLISSPHVFYLRQGE